MNVIQNAIIDETAARVQVVRPKNMEADDAQTLIVIEPMLAEYRFECSTLLFTSRVDWNAFVSIMKTIEQGFRGESNYATCEGITAIQCAGYEKMAAAIEVLSDGENIRLMMFSNTYDSYGAKESDDNWVGGIWLTLPRTCLKSIARAIGNIEKDAIFEDSFTSDVKDWALPVSLKVNHGNYSTRAERKRMHLDSLDKFDLPFYSGWRMLIDKIFVIDRNSSQDSFMS